MLGIKGIFTNQLDSIKFNVPHCTYVTKLHGKLTGNQIIEFCMWLPEFWNVQNDDAQLQANGEPTLGAFVR